MNTEILEDKQLKNIVMQGQNKPESQFGNKQNKKLIQKQKKLTIAEAYFKGVKQDPYDPVSNPLGYIIFGLSVNRRLMPIPLQYLPKFLTIKDLNYGNFGANDEFNQFVAKLSSNVYSQKQTKSALNLSCLLDILIGRCKAISTEGEHKFIDLQPILSYSGSKIVEQTLSKLHLIFISNSQRQSQLIEKAKKAQKPTILVFENRNEILRVQNQNVFVFYQVQLNQNISFASVHCVNPNKLEQILDVFNLHSVSTLTQAAALANVQPEQDQRLDRAQIRLKTNVIELIKQLDSVQIKRENLLFFNGATSILAFVAKVFFRDGDTISVDTPVYQGIQSDFNFKVSLKFETENIFKSTLLRRVSRAKQDGSKGYVIINANNPSGYVYSEKQIREVCQWAADNQDFTLIFDEMYINLIHEGGKSCSSAEYAQKLPNIQSFRGFAKQFGLCGFKIAYLITSNQKAKVCYDEWKHMLIPHPYTLNIVSNLMQATQNGQQIIKTGLSIAQEAIKSACAELDKYKIKYLKPKGGVFVFIDLRDYLKQNINLNEYLVFKKLFYEYKVNLCCGSDYKCPQPGWFRLCPVIEQQYVPVGIRRIHLMLNDEPLS